MLFLALACSKPEPIAFCASDTRLDYHPDPATSFTVFPDDHWTTPANTRTGLKVAMETSKTPLLADYPENFVGIFDDLSTLDGFGLTAGIWFTALTTMPEFSADDLILYADGKRWPVEPRLTDNGRTLILLPYFPLPESSEVVAILRTDPKKSTCLAPSAYLKSLLDPATESPPPLAERWQTALTKTGISPEEVGAMTVFTTQSATQVSRAVAADIATRDYLFGTPICLDTDRYRQCDVPLTLQDYRQEDGLVPEDSDGSPLGSFSLPVRVWKPLTATGPLPVILCGHGLGGDKGQCDILAENAVPLGLVVVAVDAVEHGDHPGKTIAPIELIQDFMIFAITIDPPGLNALRLRDNFRQSAWDKLQVVQALGQSRDLDGDGVDDVDPEHIGYVGVSLGAIMGPEPLALSGQLDAAALVVGGGRLSSIIQESPSFSILVDVMRPPGLGDGDVDRFFPVLQTILDAGDPMVFGAQVFEQEHPPQLLNMIAFEDQVVPNTSNEAMARGLGIPGIGTELWPVAEVAFEPGPVTANYQGVTAGLVQYGMVQEVEGGEWVPVEHDNLHESVQGMQQILDFLLPALAGQAPTIAEPDRP